MEASTNPEDQNWSVVEMLEKALAYAKEHPGYLHGCLFLFCDKSGSVGFSRFLGGAWNEKTLASVLASQLDAVLNPETDSHTVSTSYDSQKPN